MTTDDRRRLPLPAHLVIYASLSAGAYAVLLAGVTALESGAEAQQAADRAPLVSGIAEVSAGHDALAARLARARAAYEAAAAAYGEAGGPLSDLHAALGTLATTVGQIDGASRSLPTSLKLPTVARSVASGTVPTVQAVTGASGAVK